MTATVQHIDIHAEKIIDWCVSRGQLQSDWLTQLKSVQSKVKNTLANAAFGIPVEVQRAMEEDGLTYWSCLDAIERVSAALLIERGHAPTDTGKLKNFFGRYTDAPLKALNALVGLYRSQNLFLAEGARCLSQSVSYDIPQARKLIQTSTKQNEDLVRKIGEETKAARELKLKSQQQLRDNWRLHFVGADLAQQIKNRAEEDLPELINAVIKETKDAKFGDAIEYYREFVRYSMQDTRAAVADAASADDVDSPPFPTLLSMRASDLLDEHATQTDATASVELDASGIDWGISVEGSGDAAGGGGGGINWDVDEDVVDTPATEAAPATGGIDWGDDDDDASAEPAAADGIDWGIETTESGSAEDASAASAAASVVAPSAAASLLESESTRHAFLGELQELESFLAVRVVDLATADDVSAAAFQSSGVSHILALQSEATCSTYLAAVRSCLVAFRASRLQQLLLVRSSKRYADRVVAAIRQQSSAVDRLERAAITHEERRLELRRVTERTAHELERTLDRTRAMKTRMEAAISNLFQNRPVHLVGEIHNLLQQA